MPDIYTPFDTTVATAYFQKIARKGLIGDFSLDYLDKYRLDLKDKYPDFASFSQHFDAEGEIFNALLAEVEKAGIERKETEEERQKSDYVLKQNLKASFARHLFSVSAYYQVINELNEAYNKALEVLQDDTFKKMKLSYK